MINQERLKQVVRYDPETGLFTRIEFKPHTDIAKVLAGSKVRNRYIELSIDGKRYTAHRLAFLYVNGEFPRGVVDHINGVKIDNRICNLRDVSPRVNMENRRMPLKRNKAGILGVTKVERKCGTRFRAEIKANGVYMSLGVYATAEEAGVAYIEAKRRHHAGCTI